MQVNGELGRRELSSRVNHSPARNLVTKQRIRRFDPVQLGKVTGVLYGIMGLLFAPLFVFISMVAPKEAGFDFGIGFAIGIPVVYACIGAVMSMIGALLYNAVAGWVGGIEVEVE